MEIIDKAKQADISTVDNWDKNPRAIQKEDFERLKAQIKELGVYKPLICYEHEGRYIVLGGNMRLRALKALGTKEVWLVVVKPQDYEE